MQYNISIHDVESRFIEICFIARNITTADIEIQLPCWRPGVYQIQNFAKNIQFIKAISPTGESLEIFKIKKDRWRVNLDGFTEVKINYNYYCAIQNAGSSYIDVNLWYLNFINFCMYVEGFINDPCSIHIDLPDRFEIACGLPRLPNGMLQATDYFHLVDSPMVASNNLQHTSLEIEGTAFHIWLHGELKPDWKRIKNDFRIFIREQLATMSEFPEPDYHFLNLILPIAFYDGSEHRNSTVIVLGPNNLGEELYRDLLSISSHELFHAWNIVRIRPKELMPYDFTKENYFSTCFVVEGVTTYYGDLLLRRSGVMDELSYVNELQILIKRHFQYYGHASQSLVESSFDLWLDGYEYGIPNRKISVYDKGALVALILDLYIRKKTNQQKSLDDVMVLLWNRFGKPLVGYTLQDYKDIIEVVAGESLDWYWNECILSNQSIQSMLNEALSYVGLRISIFSNENVQLGITDDDRGKIQRDIWLASRQEWSEDYDLY